MTYIKHFRQQARTKYGKKFRESVFSKAVNKMRREAIRLYGGSPSHYWNCLETECPKCIIIYYKDTLDNPDGIHTLNNEYRRPRRKT